MTRGPERGEQDFETRQLIAREVRCAYGAGIGIGS